MADDKHASAIETVAREVLRRATDAAEWELYPDIGESDWEAIVEKARQIAGDVDGDTYWAAYEYLQRRAEQWAKENPGG